MPRQPRINIPDIAQHIIQRGNNKEPCFYNADDYAVYLAKMEEYAAKFEVEIHAFVLMPNHVHMLLTPKLESAISKFMQALGRYYVQYINRTYGRSGTLWEGRYRATVVGTDAYFLQVSRYIELNPVRSKIVLKPSDYPWSSYQHNAMDNHIDMIIAHHSYLSLGKNTGDRKFTYCHFVNLTMPTSIVNLIRNSTNKSWAIGDEAFITQIEQQLSRRLSPINKTHGKHFS
ncbi:MAG: transposase [Saccharospirillaceae bacterium]|nr:transposase [Pseudomonadales bacterium]NRB79062.1 transposase [Saccharospirillaceae bacterium]